MKGGGFLAFHLRGLCSSWASASFLYWERKDRDDEIANSYRISNGTCMALSANFFLIFSTRFLLGSSLESCGIPSKTIHEHICVSFSGRRLRRAPFCGLSLFAYGFGFQRKSWRKGFLFGKLFCAGIGVGAFLCSVGEVCCGKFGKLFFVGDGDKG